MSGPQDAKSRKESMKERLQHDENAWVAAETAFNEQFAQLFRYVRKLEERITDLETSNKVLKKQLRKLIGATNDKKSKA